MVQCGDMVVYGIHGVCRIVNVECRVVDRKAVEYFVLEPSNQPDAKFYIPTGNPAAVAKLRKLLTADALEALLDSEEVKADGWIANESVRKEKYRELISRADCAELIRMIRALYVHKQEQLAAGKKFHQCDENFLKDAERLISAEVSYVLDMPLNQVGEYIRSRIEK